MKIRMNSWVVIGVGIGVMLARSAQAGVTIYSDQTSFDAATTGLSTVGFNGIVPTNGFTDYSIPPGYTDPGTGTNFTFPTASGTDINITGPDYYSFNYGFPVFPAAVVNSSGSVPAGASERITLPVSATALSLFFTTYDALPITIVLSNGDTYVDSTSPPFGTFDFLGITDTAAFSSLTITEPTASGVLIASLQFGTTVPEPSTLALLGISSWMLARFRRRGRSAISGD
jgi:hypothetical protein